MDGTNFFTRVKIPLSVSTVTTKRTNTMIDFKFDLQRFVATKLTQDMFPANYTGDVGADSPIKLESLDYFRSVDRDADGNPTGSRHQYAVYCYVLEAGSYTLSQDLNLDRPILIKGDVTLDLNGHTITRTIPEVTKDACDWQAYNKNSYFESFDKEDFALNAICIQGDGSLNLSDSSTLQTGKVTTQHGKLGNCNMGTIQIEEQGSFTMTSGTVEGADVAVKIDSTGTIDISGQDTTISSQEDDIWLSFRSAATVNITDAKLASYRNAIFAVPSKEIDGVNDITLSGIKLVNISDNADDPERENVGGILIANKDNLTLINTTIHGSVSHQGGGNLTIKDCNITNDQGAVEVSSGTVATIENSTIESAKNVGVQVTNGASLTISGDTSISADSYFGMWNSGGSVTMNGGTVTGSLGWYAVRNYNGGSFELNDGLLFSDLGIAFINEKSSITVNGGKISGVAGLLNSAGEANICDGTVEATVAGYGLKNEGGSLTVSGGTITSNGSNAIRNLDVEVGVGERVVNEDHMLVYTQFETVPDCRQKASFK